MINWVLKIAECSIHRGVSALALTHCVQECRRGDQVKRAGEECRGEGPKRSAGEECRGGGQVRFAGEECRGEGLKWSEGEEDRKGVQKRRARGVLEKSAGEWCIGRAGEGVREQER